MATESSIVFGSSVTLSERGCLLALCLRWRRANFLDSLKAGFQHDGINPLGFHLKVYHET